MSANNDFSRQVVEADTQREKEMKSRKEAQKLKLEIDKQNNEASTEDGIENSSQSAYSVSGMSNSDSRLSSGEPLSSDVRIRQLENENKELKLTYINLEEHKELLSYKLALIQDQIEDLSDSLRITQKELAEKKRLNSYQQGQVNELTNRNNFLKKQVELRDQLIVDNNLIACSNVDEEKPSVGDQIKAELLNNDKDDITEMPIKGSALLSEDVIDLLKELSEKDLESCIRKLCTERHKLQRQTETLQKQLNDERDDYGRSDRKGSKKINGDDYETLKQNYNGLKTQFMDHKLQLQSSNQKISSLESENKSCDNKIKRLEGQVKRYKSIAEECEKQEDELKKDKRKVQKELREAQSRIEDLKSENSTLIKKNEKLMKQLSKK